MKKKLFAVLSISLLVMSFASARIFNIGFGFTYDYALGKIATNKVDPRTFSEYCSEGFGLDSSVSLTFGEWSEVYLDEMLNIPSNATLDGNDFEDLAPVGYESKVLLNTKFSLGYAQTIIRRPFKLSLGVGATLGLFLVDYVKDENTNITQAIVNVGANLRAKAEFELFKHCVVYLKGNFDFFPVNDYMVLFTPDDTENPASYDIYYDKLTNWDINASLGFIFYF